jgi:hypothetical protein
MKARAQVQLGGVRGHSVSYIKAKHDEITAETYTYMSKIKCKSESDK